MRYADLDPILLDLEGLRANWTLGAVCVYEACGWHGQIDYLDEIQS